MRSSSSCKSSVDELLTSMTLMHASFASLLAFAVREQSHADAVVAEPSIFENPVAHVRHLSYSAPVHVAQET